MSRFVRILFSILLPIFFALDRILFRHSPLAWRGLALLLLLYLCNVWLDQRWWTRRKYALTVTLVL